MKINVKKILITITGLFLFGASFVVFARDSKEPIIIPTHNWNSQIVMAYVIGGIFESMGNNVEYKSADSQAVYESVRTGDITISHEVWQSAFGKSFYKAMEKGGLVDAGNHAALTLEDLGVPKYVIDNNLCPGLPDWKALKQQKCVDAFKTADSGNKGRILEGPQSWHGDLIPNRIKALGLGDKYTVKFAGSADALWAELASAKKDGRAILMFNWTPNFTDADGFSFIKFPPYYDGCRISDGGDEACGSPNGWLKKAANYKMAKKWPAAYTTYTKISFDTAQIGMMAALVDVKKLSHKDAAKKWLADNKKIWKAWAKK